MSPELTGTIERREEILDKIREILIENLLVPCNPEDIDPDTPLFGTGLGLDSVDAVELLVSVEVEFGVIIDDDMLGRSIMRTVNTLADYVLLAGESTG